MKDTETGIDRRTFVGTVGAVAGMGAMGLSGGPMRPAWGAEESKAIDGPAIDQAVALAEHYDPTYSGPDDLVKGNTPDEYASLGCTTTSVWELNRWRHEMVDQAEEFVREDGTVEPAVYNKLRVLFHSYAGGIGPSTYESGQCIDLFKILFTEEEAGIYLEMPFGVEFTPAQFAQESGREEEECKQICEDFAQRALLYHAHRSGIDYYHHLAVWHGLCEYGLERFYDQDYARLFVDAFKSPQTISGPAYNSSLHAGTPLYHVLPCDESVVSDEEGILPLQDYNKIIDRNEVIGVSPCMCRLRKATYQGETVPYFGTEELKTYVSPICGHKIETCFSFGEEAEYYIERGIARQIGQEEARRLLAENVQAGFVLESCCTSGSEIICCCHGDCCGPLSGFKAIGTETCAASTSFIHISDYILDYDREACIQCGACVERCPMEAIAMDEDNRPIVSGVCVRCGQCGLACPVGARTLHARPAEERLPMSDSFIDDYNRKAGFRYDHGQLA